jgi:hypothetical protein
MRLIYAYIAAKKKRALEREAESLASQQRDKRQKLDNELESTTTTTVPTDLAALTAA